MDAVTPSPSAFAPAADADAPSDAHHTRHVVEVVIEVVGIVSLIVALGVDLISRFVTHEPALHHIGTVVVVVATVAACLDAGITVIAHRREEEGRTLHMLLDVLAALLLVVSLIMRVRYWENDQGTPIRAIVPSVLAFALIALASWTNITGRPAPTIGHSGEAAG